MTNRAIVVLAVAATACLALGARLLDAASTGTTASAGTTDSTGTTAIAVLVLAVGTALAAAAVIGAWRPTPQRPEPDSH